MILEVAREAVVDRGDAYGDALTNHERIARLWTARLAEKLVPGRTLSAVDVIACMRLVKEARLMETPGHYDSLVDLAGYAEVEARAAAALEERSR